MPEGQDLPDPNPLSGSADDALDAGIAENLMGANDTTVPLDEQHLAVPIYQPKGRRAAASWDETEIKRVAHRDSSGHPTGLAATGLAWRLRGVRRRTFQPPAARRAMMHTALSATRRTV